MAIILKKLKGKNIRKDPQNAEWEHLLTLIKVLVILFVIFSSFHWIIKKRVNHLPVQVYSSSVSAPQKKAVQHQLYTVQEGDTLWKIAVKHYPGENPINKIKEIKELNGLIRDEIKPGQPIKLP